MKKIFPLSLILLSCLPNILAQNSPGKIKPAYLEYSGLIELTMPFMTDSLDASQKPYEPAIMLDIPFVRPTKFEVINDSVIVVGGDNAGLHYISFPLRNTGFAEVNLEVSGSDRYKIYVDGKESSGKLKLKPGLRDVTVRLLTLPEEKDSVSFTIVSPQLSLITTENNSDRRPYTIEDVLFAPHLKGVRVSPPGKYALVEETTVSPDRSQGNTITLLDAKTSKPIGKVPKGYDWFPDKDILWRSISISNGKKDIQQLDPETMEESIFISGVPEGDFFISPNEKYLIYSTRSSGPKEDPDMYRVLNPEDRQPGWRDRSGVAVLDIASGVYRPVTFGNANVSVADMSSDGSKLLLMAARNRFGKRPTTLFSLYEYNLDTNKADTLVWEDGFISSAFYSPDSKKIGIIGSPEALGGVAKTLPDSIYPNMTEGELFIMDVESGTITTPTRDFNPSVRNAVWPSSSSFVFFTAEDKDKISLFTYNPETGKIASLNVPEDIVNSFSVADNGTSGFFIGESALNPDVLYSFDLKKGVPEYKKIKSPGDKMLSEVNLAKVENWDFINSKGDTINGRFYLPPDFDPEKKYPLIVNYYGGCSPTSRNFATRYPHHLYATNGYVVYVVNPSGATGFGQEFASRHVNTAGEGVAQDIIEGTKKFAEEHPFIDQEKIGCIGASYGGFMTQYLQTLTDLFAAAISHAGISDHTSYWGNGYWGYSYSEVSMADSYPWSDTDLYVKQSPLYNADKINTPILFLHGDEDTNVPPAESVQLFTALKLLGKDTALVEIAGQNHHILDIDKRIKWQDAIFAWFAKYLQDDPTWWDTLFPPTSL